MQITFIFSWKLIKKYFDFITNFIYLKYYWLEKYN